MMRTYPFSVTAYCPSLIGVTHNGVVVKNGFVTQLVRAESEESAKSAAVLTFDEIFGIPENRVSAISVELIQRDRAERLRHILRDDDEPDEPVSSSPVHPTPPTKKLFGN
jgi:hypothetical protein